MIVETIRLSQKAKEQLLRLKALTGLKQWNGASPMAWAGTQESFRSSFDCISIGELE